MTTRYRTGLILAALLGAVDVISLALTDGENPPYAVAAVGAALGLITLAGVVRTWRTARSRGWFWTVVVTRAVSALTSVPAFFAGAPAALQAAVGVGIVLTLTSLWLLLATRRTATV
ncbi:hypothetical protein [Actinomadura sp. NTSP31]|uniref:hypothetical protein n=1 Tax=Actinomadura sp. NTSP31 TaxID=1735447 RepID=UPI0035C1A9F9